MILSSRCTQLDVDAMTRVVAAGLGRNPSKLGEHIYNAGLPYVRDRCQIFLSALANGGKIPKPVKEADEKENGPLESSETKTET